MKSYWEIIADNLRKARWRWGCVSAVDQRVNVDQRDYSSSL
jgi:hypothetical protein